MRSLPLALLAFVLAPASCFADIPRPMIWDENPNPPWPASYRINASTIMMPCNWSGFIEPTIAATYGVVSFDWSNGRSMWSNRRPMDDEQMMVEQIAQVKAINPTTHCWVYRNLAKALPWMKTIRDKMLDPRFGGFFLKFGATPPPNGSNPDTNGSFFSPKCDLTYSTPICSDFWHDQASTPQFINSTEYHRHDAGFIHQKDGSCLEAPCDCGPGLPCGEYAFDHRNGSMLRDWLTNDYFLGPMGAGNPNITGVFIDDFWCYGSSCSDPAPGPSETEKHAALDMGLSAADIKAISFGWRDNMEHAHRGLLQKGAWAWDLFPNMPSAGCCPS
eukprot:COSAG06_NODE_12775_length_1331_cov_2.163961_1_plen_330_part_10